MAPPRIAVFGAGLIGRRHAAQAMAQAQLCAIVDPADAARAHATKLGVPHFRDSVDCLSQVRPDGVVIATPNSLHTEQALMCIDHRLPVLIEKPIADTVVDADRIVAAAHAAGTPVLVGHHRRHNPIIQRAKAEIDAGTLGQVVAVQGQFWLYKPDDYFDAAWRREPGAGPAMINFIHDIDLLRMLCGDITDVQAMRANHIRGHPVEETAVALFRFANGALGTFTLSDTIVAPWSWEMTSGENPIYPHRPGACYQIGGTKASLSLPDLQLWRHDGARSWWNPIDTTQLDTVGDDAFARQFTHFINVIGGATPLVSAEAGRDSLAVVERVLAAALPREDPT